MRPHPRAATTRALSGTESTGERLRDPSVPLWIDRRYEVLGEAGRGAMGVVYKARDHATGTLVAIKTLLRGGPETLVDEGTALAAVSHPLVPATYGMGQVGSTPFLLMQWIEGRTLAERLGDDGPFDLAQAVAIALQVTEAAAAVHGVGFAHRDIKPDNIVVHGDRVTLLDFGAAIPRAQSRSAAIVGTPGYLAPEAFRPPVLDAAALDVFAIGILMAELLVGFPPCTEEPGGPRLSPIVRGGPLREVVAAAVSCEPRRRPDCLALLDGLRGVQQQLP